MKLAMLLVVLMSCARPQPAAPRFEPTAFGVTVHGEGRPIIFVPALSVPGTIWEPTVASLGPGYQAHVLTLAGFAGQPPIDGPLLAQARAQLATYIRDRHLERPILVGHSLGGVVCLWLAITDPALVGPVVAVDVSPYGMALEDPALTPAIVEEGVRRTRDQIVGADRAGFEAQGRARFAEMITDPAAATRWADAAMRSDPRTVGDSLLELLTLDLRPQAHSIASPVLLIAAAGNVPPERWPEMEHNWRLQADMIPDHELVVIPGSRHFVMLDAPTPFHEALRGFLDRHR